MGIIDIIAAALLTGLAGCVAMMAFAHLNKRDAYENPKNRQAACQRHEWTKPEGKNQNAVGLVCRLCGKVPG